MTLIASLQATRKIFDNDGTIRQAPKYGRDCGAIVWALAQNSAWTLENMTNVPHFLLPGRFDDGRTLVHSVLFMDSDFTSIV